MVETGQVKLWHHVWWHRGFFFHDVLGFDSNHFSPKTDLISSSSCFLILLGGTHDLKGTYPNEPLWIFVCIHHLSQNVYLYQIFGVIVLISHSYQSITLHCTVAPVWIDVLNLKSMSVSYSGSQPPHWGLNQQMKRRTIFWFLWVMFIFHYDNFSENKLKSYCACSCLIPLFFFFFPTTK